jgi:hypothetical protein
MEVVFWVLGCFRSFVDASRRVKNKHRFHVDLLPFIRPGGKTVGMHESLRRPPPGRHKLNV